MLRLSGRQRVPSYSLARHYRSYCRTSQQCRILLSTYRPTRILPIPTAAKWSPSSVSTTRVAICFNGQRIFARELHCSPVLHKKKPVLRKHRRKMKAFEKLTSLILERENRYRKRMSEKEGVEFTQLKALPPWMNEQIMAELLDKEVEEKVLKDPKAASELAQRLHTNMVKAIEDAQKFLAKQQIQDAEVKFDPEREEQELTFEEQRKAGADAIARAKAIAESGELEYENDFGIAPHILERFKQKQREWEEMQKRGEEENPLLKREGLIEDPEVEAFFKSQSGQSQQLTPLDDDSDYSSIPTMPRKSKPAGKSTAYPLFVRRSKPAPTTSTTEQEPEGPPDSVIEDTEEFAETEDVEEEPEPMPEELKKLLDELPPDEVEALQFLAKQEQGVHQLEQPPNPEVLERIAMRLGNLDTPKDAKSTAQQESSTQEIESDTILPRTECCANFEETKKHKHFDCFIHISEAMRKKGKPDTPLHFAAHIGAVDFMKNLLKQHKLNINTQGTHGITPLHLAAEQGHLEAVDILLRNGANPNMGDSAGVHPLHLALGLENPQCAMLLLSRGARVSGSDNEGNSALHYAADAVTNHALLRELVRRCNDVNVVNRNGETPLRMAAEAGNIDAVQPKIDVNKADSGSITPLLVAAKEGYTEIVKALIRKGADPSLPDGSGSFAIHWSALGGHTECCRLLVEEGKSLVIARNDEQWTPLHLAVQERHPDTVEYLLKAHAPVNVVNAEGVSPLLLAVYINNLEIVKMLLNHGADPNIPDAQGVTPLYAAIQNHSNDLALELLNRRCNVNTRTVDGETPLMLAISEENWEIANELLNRGADPNLTTHEGATCMHMAAAVGSIEWVNKLLALGLDINAATRRGVTPLKVALDNGHTELAEYLESRGARQLDLFTYIEMQEKKRKLYEEMKQAKGSNADNVIVGSD